MRINLPKVAGLAPTLAPGAPGRSVAATLVAGVTAGVAAGALGVKAYQTVVGPLWRQGDGIFRVFRAVDGWLNNPATFSLSPPRMVLGGLILAGGLAVGTSVAKWRWYRGRTQDFAKLHLSDTYPKMMQHHIDTIAVLKKEKPKDYLKLIDYHILQMRRIVNVVRGQLVEDLYVDILTGVQANMVNRVSRYINSADSLENYVQRAIEVAKDLHRRLLDMLREHDPVLNDELAAQNSVERFGARLQTNPARRVQEEPV